jgi:hypothetical protein
MGLYSLVALLGSYWKSNIANRLFSTDDDNKWITLGLITDVGYKNTINYKVSYRIC